MGIALLEMLASSLMTPRFWLTISLLVIALVLRHSSFKINMSNFLLLAIRTSGTHCQAGLVAGNTFVPASQRGRGAFGSLGPGSRPHSRPNSRHQNRPELPSSLSMDDTDAFPTLGSAKRGSKHHGQRSRHGHGAEKETPSSLADVVRMSPSPAPGQQRKVETGRKIRTYGSSESAAARKIPEPQHIPWLETGARANQQYLKYRQEAIKHGSIRNKFLQR